MKKNNFQQNFLQQVAACALVISSLALAGNSDAATAMGTANATVVEPASVIIAPPTPVTTPALSGTIFNLESFTNSLSTSGPLLRAVAPPPSDAVVIGTEGGAVVQGGTRAGAAPSAANSATVSVTRKADGSLSVSGGTGLTFSVSQPGVGAVNIEYN